MFNENQNIMKAQIEQALKNMNFSDEEIQNRIMEVEKLNLSCVSDVRLWIKNDKIRIYATHKDNRNNSSYYDVVSLVAEAGHGKSIEYKVVNQVIEGTQFK